MTVLKGIDICHTYFENSPWEKTVLRDVSFRVGSSELVVLSGPNGADKATLARILAGLLVPSSGKKRNF